MTLDELKVSMTTVSSFLTLSMMGPYTIAASLLGEATKLAVSATGLTISEKVISASPASFMTQNLALYAPPRAAEFGAD